MSRFSERSKAILDTCHPFLVDLFMEVVKGYDCTILCGHRSQEDQEKAFHEGRTKVHWPDSLHNSNPSLGVDVAPYPIDWNDLNRFYHFGGYVWRTAENMGILVRWGGDWTRNLNFKDQYFFDLPHWELFGMDKETIADDILRS